MVETESGDEPVAKMFLKVGGQEHWIVKTNGYDTAVSDKGEIFHGLIFVEEFSLGTLKPKNASVIRWTIRNSSRRGTVLLEADRVKKISLPEWGKYPAVRTVRNQISIDLFGGRVVGSLDYDQLPEEVAEAILARLRDFAKEEYGFLPDVNTGGSFQERMWNFVQNPLDIRMAYLKDFLGSYYEDHIRRDDPNPFNALADFLKVPQEIRTDLYQDYLKNPYNIKIYWFLREVGVKNYSNIRKLFNRKTLAGLKHKYILC